MRSRYPVVSGFLIFAILLATCSMPSFVPTVAVADSPPMQPVVAIHKSDYTNALKGMPDDPATPADAPGGWYYDSFWHFQVTAMLEEALKADGTPYVEVTDADIESGALMSGGAPKYPILFSLAAECVSDAEVGQIRDYTNAGGQVFAGGSSWIRNADGTYRDSSGHAEMALSSEMGLESVPLGDKPGGGTWSWGHINTIRRDSDDSLVSHITTGQDLFWPLPEKYNTDAAGMVLDDNGSHNAWVTTPTSTDPATVLVHSPELLDYPSSTVPVIATKAYGAGRFIYSAEMAPLAGWGGYAPDTSEYLFFRRAIENAFKSAGLPLVRLSAGSTRTRPRSRRVGTATSTTVASPHLRTSSASTGYADSTSSSPASLMTMATR